METLYIFFHLSHYSGKLIKVLRELFVTRFIKESVFFFEASGFQALLIFDFDFMNDGNGKWQAETHKRLETQFSSNSV